MITLYTAGDANSHKALGERLRGLKPGEYTVEIKRNRPIRSLSQNRYYFAILKVIAAETGEYDIDRLHELCKKKFNGELMKLPKSGMEQIGLSTSNLDSAEFTAYINRVKTWSLDEFNISIPDPSNMTHQLLMDIENNYERVFSGF